MATLVGYEWYMCNHPIEDLNTRLSELKATLPRFFDLIRTLEETAEEIAAFGRISTASSELLSIVRRLVPQLCEDYERLQAAISILHIPKGTPPHGNEFGRSLLSTVEDVDQAHTTIHDGLIQAKRYVQQLTTICQHQRQLIIESYLAQLSDLILTLENTTQIIRNKVNCLASIDPRLDELRQLMLHLETNGREFQRSFELYEMIAERVPLTLADTVETFANLREFISIVSAYVELAEMICIELLD